VLDKLKGMPIEKLTTRRLTGLGFEFAESGFSENCKNIFNPYQKEITHGAF
jgi:hypothetical protein